ncbi:MAG TPA: caspase family protein [Herpetosiphon sp.]|uniref:Peptidase C14 caspase catalytic subunit p20 n=1 Tax=Herpetosiphon aurantiacus (strain ATCC 23779 / DSM 785 / 114-95) TaxID=316274 RepID=A9AXA2_HERA2|nr:caspase family protein [Herpetosiphon sp.]ABX06822.1 peptidase C14 caspase catalytic subunit p20 [Herpetosiphon aurantiacus DSM 785]HBW52829.1 caspase family protein [Herpetosiphon sp.]
MPKRLLVVAVGVSVYANPAIPPLPTCRDDAQVFLNALRPLSTQPLLERVLFDDQATKANIQVTLEWLAGEVAADDLAIVYYSGHGASFDDDNGDESDGKEEFLCPYECGMEQGVGSFVRDDELRVWLTPIREKAPLLVVLDACHSGTGAMAPAGLIAKELPAGLVKQIIGNATIPAGAGGDPIPANQVLLAGCQDSEQSYILPGEPNSLFTAKLVEQIAAGQTADIQSLFEATYNAVLDASDVAGIQQTPKISNGLSAPLALRSA